MSEPWRGPSKYYCDYCEMYVRDTAQEKKKHEASTKHKSSIERKIREKRKTQETEQRKKQIQSVTQFQNLNQTTQNTQTTQQKKTTQKNQKFKKKQSKEAQLKAQMRQDQFNQYYSKGNSGASNVATSLPMGNILSLDESYMKTPSLGEEEKTNKEEEVEYEEKEEVDEEDIQEQIELSKLKAKQEEYDDDYYNNPDFFFTEESAEYDQDELKKQEEELKLKKLERKREKEEEERKKRLEIEKQIQEKEYLKRMDTTTGLAKWEDCEEYEVEKEEVKQEEEEKEEKNEQIKIEEIKKETDQEGIIKFSMDNSSSFDDSFVMTSFKIENNEPSSTNNPKDKKKLFRALSNEEKEEKMQISEYDYSESREAKKRKIQSLDDLLK